uniref:Uncharacterized protein n=1 Tax=Chrysotila carterae TaxID=13221 RepID=A0A7S4BHU9_CHRCT
MRAMLLLAAAGVAAAWTPSAHHTQSLTGRFFPVHTSKFALNAHSTRPSAVLAHRSPAPILNEREAGVRAGLVTEVPFEVRFSIGNVISVSGGLLLVYCVGSYLFNNGQSDLIQTLGFVYAIPALVGGLALKYAELPPVPLATSPEAEKLRETKGTKIQKKILSDATRFTYGDAHMEEPLKALKLAPRGVGPPELKSLREGVSPNGGYELGMTFYAPNTPFRVWKDRAPRYARFFGPNVRAVLRKVDVEQRLVELTLITMEEGETDEPLEVLDDGSLAPVQTAAEEEAAAAAA